MRTLTDEDKERLMDELTKSVRDAHTQYFYELTTQQFAEKCGMSYGYAKKFLAKQVGDGKMVKRKVSSDGKTYTVYSVI